MSCFSGPKQTIDGLILDLDVANRKSYSPNRFPTPTDLYLTYASKPKNNCVITRDTSTYSPVGQSPMLMYTTGNDPYISSYNGGLSDNIYSVNAGETWTVSVYAKARENTTGEIFIFGADSNGTAFNGGWYDITSTNLTITKEWQRFSHSITFANTSTRNIQVRLDGTIPLPSANNYIWFDGMQVERSSTPTKFNSLVSGEFIYDLSGNNRGTLINKPYLNSDGLKFQANLYQEITFANTSNLQFLGNSPYTLEAWVYPTRNPGINNWTGIFNREWNMGLGRDGYNIYFLGSAGTSTYFTTERWCSGNNNNISVTVDSSLSTNNWNHIVVTYDGNMLSLYRNGTYTGQTTSVGSITNANTTLTIAQRGGNFFEGKISSTKIYNKALSTKEVLDNFNAFRGRFGI